MSVANKRTPTLPSRRDEMSVANEPPPTFPSRRDDPFAQGFNQEERFSVLAKRAEREVEVLKAAKAMEGVKKLEK
jgi:hypothetical protein